MNRRFTSIYLYGEGLVNKVKKYKVAWKHTQTFSFMNPKEETGLASCYITCANKTDRQREKSKRSNTNEIIEHWTWKSREPNRKKLEITFQINLSVAIQVSCFDDLTDFFSQLITKVHHGPLEFFSTYKPVTIHVKHFEHFSYLCFCVCFFHPGVHQVEKFSKVNDAIVLEKKM